MLETLCYNNLIKLSINTSLLTDKYKFEVIIKLLEKTNVYYKI